MHEERNPAAADPCVSLQAPGDADPNAGVRDERDALLVCLRQVDDVLSVLHIAAVGGDYRKALHDMISLEIQIENDPAVSSTAKARSDELAQLRQDLSDARNLFGAHTAAVADFLNELYAVMVDPLAEGTVNVEDIKQHLRAAALRSREDGRKVAAFNLMLTAESPAMRMVAERYFEGAENIEEFIKFLRNDEALGLQPKEKEVKFLIHVANNPRCGCCGRVLGEDTAESEKQRNKVTATSVFRPIYFCRTENCPQHTLRVTLEPTEAEVVQG